MPWKESNRPGLISTLGSFARFDLMNSRAALSGVPMSALMVARPKLTNDVRARIRCESHPSR
jgi:hypothetical protein